MIETGRVLRKNKIICNAFGEDVRNLKYNFKYLYRY